MPVRQHPKLLVTLEKLLEWPGADLPGTLARACDVVAEALGADKVDAFLHDPSRDSLVALGVSDQPLSHLQRSVGLDVLQLANRGRIVQVHESGEPFASGRVDEDPEELYGIKHVLRVASLIAVPLNVGETRHGVLAVAWQKRDAYEPGDVAFTKFVAHWVGIVAHRAELVEQIANSAAEQGRQAVAEELITVLAHDLRNHLAPIDLRFSVLRMRAEKEGRTKDVHDCDGGMRVMGRLRAMVSNILDVARLDRGVFQLDMQPLDLAALVRDICKLMTSAERPLDVQVPESVLVVADAERIRQALENLVVNAIHHSPRGVAVGLSVTEHDDRVSVEIADRGSGIPPEILPRIFDRFVTGRPGAGLGLGLYMARRIARLHGGELEVAPGTGVGTRFVLTLPRHNG